MFDFAGNYELVPKLKLYAKLTNAFDTAYLAARRPFGARPGQAMWVQGGAKYEF